MPQFIKIMLYAVHGDIRHLEIKFDDPFPDYKVHGDIRHLEIQTTIMIITFIVHGDIRHLEKVKLPRSHTR